ncbi:MAG TPA: zinc ribbon domain-containing protein [Gemmatimonadaceae bacterium]|nr:zinc ribbon domain-containing protein [Gemmatimonadaceae bacterium]
MVALAVGTVLAVGALAFVLHPLFFGTMGPRDREIPIADGPRDESAVVALREIEFDRATGKLSDSDYTELRRTYTQRALAEMRATPDASEDPIEARVRAYRQTHRDCASCGLRPEADAIYCSTCGAYLEHTCPDCGSEIRESGAVFCSTCGGRLARGAERMRA